MKHRSAWFALVAGLASGVSTSAQGSNPGEVLYEQKISATAGGFGGALDIGDLLGFSTAFLGDLDGNGAADLAAGAYGDDDGGVDCGAVWILFLKRDGTVLTEKKISATAGGFGGALDGGDRFGFAVAALGDLDGDDVPDLAVSASMDDDGGTNQGAVWILFLNSDGTVKDEKKISETEGGFTGTLDDSDSFGTGLESLGDLDGNGTADLAAGAFLDDDGGPSRGAVWILFLNSDGTVASEAKLSSTSGGLAGPLSDGDQFGRGIANLGDIDGPGGSELAMAVGAPGDSQAAAAAGAVWILFLSQAGTVLSESKITEGAGGFGGDLDAGDWLGLSLEPLGDMGPGVSALGAGAPLDDDGLGDAGAVWIVFIDASGTAVSQQKISATAGGFSGLLGNNAFGVSLASSGDLDGDGRPDLSVGEQDDDGFSGAGAVWNLFLNDGTLTFGASATVWTGAVSRVWTNASNWTNGVPTQTKSAIIPDVANDPLTSGFQTCNALLMEPGALLELDNNNFAVFGGATIHGTVSGAHEFRAEGAGVFAGAGTISGKTLLKDDVTVQGGPLMLADLEAREDLTVEAAGELVVSGNADLVPSSSAVLSGTGTLDLDGAVDLEMTDGTSVPRLEIAGQLSIDSAVFTPSSGTVRFDGTVAQVVTQLSGSPTQFANVEVAASADVTIAGDVSLLAALDLEGVLDVGADLDIEGDFFGGALSSLSAGGIQFGGSIEHGGMLSSGNRIEVGEGSTADIVVDSSSSFPTGIDVDIGEGRMTLLSNFAVQGDLNLLDGTLAPGVDAALDVDALVIEADAKVETDGFLLALPGAPPVTVRGVLAVEPGGALQLSASTVSIEPGGTLRVVGGMVLGLAAGGYDLTVGAGGNLEAQEFVFRDMGIGGVVVHRDALLGAPPFDLRRGIFSRAAPGGVLLRIDRAGPTTLVQLEFKDPLGTAGNNVRVGATSAPITLRSWGGRFSGPAFEDDPLGDPGLLVWEKGKVR